MSTVFKGIVQRGLKRAESLGFPTANIPLADSSVSGIYAARVYVEDESSYMAAVYADQARKLLEAHILDFADELNGQEIKIELHKKIRASKKFPDEESLRKAIVKDVDEVRNYFKT